MVERIKAARHACKYVQFSGPAGIERVTTLLDELLTMLEPPHKPPVLADGQMPLFEEIR